jgi:phosphoribosylformylglycinamidine synthase PurS subunit
MWCASPLRLAGERLRLSSAIQSGYFAMKVNVVVTPKTAVLDPQGAAVRDAMQHLGMPEVRSVRIGKYLEIEIDDQAPDVESRLHVLCRDLLSNPVIEDYEVQGGGSAK